MEKLDFSCKYPLVSRDYEFSNLPALFKEIDFKPRKITLRKKSTKVLGGLIEFNAASIIFDR